MATFNLGEEWNEYLDNEEERRTVTDGEGQIRCMIDGGEIEMEGAADSNPTIRERITKFIQAGKNVNTVRKTSGDVQRLENWLRDGGEFRKTEEIPLVKLDELLSNFS